MFKIQILKWLIFGISWCIWLTLWYIIIFAALDWTNVKTDVTTETELSATLWNQNMINIKDNVDGLQTQLNTLQTQLSDLNTKPIFYSERTTSTTAAEWTVLYTSLVNIWWWNYNASNWEYTIPKTWIYKICSWVWYSITWAIETKLRINWTNKLSFWSQRWSGAWDIRAWQLTDYNCWIFNVNQWDKISIYKISTILMECNITRKCSFSVEYLQ